MCIVLMSSSFPDSPDTDFEDDFDDDFDDMED